MHIHKLWLIIYESRKLSKLKFPPFLEKKLHYPHLQNHIGFWTILTRVLPVNDFTASPAPMGVKLPRDKWQVGTAKRGHGRAETVPSLDNIRCGL